jgi:ABC-2 type transport system permease protein
MVEIIQTIMLAAPSTHFIVMAQAVLYRGAGFSVVWPQFMWLAGIAAALFTLSLRGFRRSLR